MENDKIILKALSYYGLHELVKGKTNPKMLELVNNISNKKHMNNIPWCAAFVGSVLKDCGLPFSETLTARSYLKIGSKTEKPVLGDITIFWRGSIDGWKGHVGFYMGENDTEIFILGGNQSNMVCVKPYPKKQLLGFRTQQNKKPMAVKKATKKAVKKTIKK